MEPIREWLDESMKHMDHAPPKHQRHKPRPESVWDGIPAEDCFEVPELYGDELTSAPHNGRWPVRLLIDKDLVANSEPSKEQVLAEFMSVATAAERLGDNVVLPKHYARFKIEPIRFICENNLNFFQGNIIKYVLRHDAKNGLEDLKKAQRYLTMFIRFMQDDPDWWKQ